MVLARLLRPSDFGSARDSTRRTQRLVGFAPLRPERDATRCIRRVKRSRASKGWRNV